LTLYGEVESAAEQGPYVPYRQLVMAVLRGLGERLGFSPSEAEQSRFAHAVGDWPPFAIDDDLFARTNQKLDVMFDWIERATTRTTTKAE